MLYEADPDLPALELPYPWTDRLMLIVYTDHRPDGTQDIQVNLSLAAMSFIQPRFRDIIRSYIALPLWIPGRRQWDDEFTPEKIQKVKENGAVWVRIADGRKPKGYLLALTPGSLNDIPEWGDEACLEKLRDLLAEL